MKFIRFGLTSCARKLIRVPQPLLGVSNDALTREDTAVHLFLQLKDWTIKSIKSEAY
jgi:hypothetical protein